MQALHVNCLQWANWINCRVERELLLIPFSWWWWLRWILMTTPISIKMMILITMTFHLFYQFTIEARRVNTDWTTWIDKYDVDIWMYPRSRLKFSDAWHQKGTSHRSGAQRDLYLVYQGTLNLHIDDGDLSLFSSARETTFSKLIRWTIQCSGA